jgi:glyoxylase-like metal-dependent hydrolase (beta-lactamase superfamily II)
VEDQVAPGRRSFEAEPCLYVTLDEREAGERLGVGRAVEVGEDQLVPGRPQPRDHAAPDVARGRRVGERILDATDVLHTPGHTLDHHSLRFDCEGRSVLIAADAAMTRDFWLDRRGYFNSADMNLAGRTIEHLATLADVVVPGHDNYFLNDR